MVSETLTQAKREAGEHMKSPESNAAGNRLRIAFLVAELARRGRLVEYNVVGNGL
jgi:hypothetical protein